eukprot:scaffold21612_cov115-Isochrysis_galbana.AAC.11
MATHELHRKTRERTVRGVGDSERSTQRPARYMLYVAAKQTITIIRCMNTHKRPRHLQNIWRLHHASASAFN